MTLLAGEKLGPYQILALIGKGGMGAVYKARDTRLDRIVALKVSVEQFNERFEREARVIASLNHPNICTLHDVGPNYLVMELVEGETLAGRIGEGPLPLELALPLARQIADALEAAHEKGIVHRDLKPGNIMIKPDGSVKVLDFGLARVASRATSAGDPEESPTLTMPATEAGVILGTAAYMAPEQARGKSVDKRADIWAFGVVFYEMLTGERLFGGEDLTEILASVVKEEPDLSAAPLEVRRLLARCLEKDPRKRLRDIADGFHLLDAAQPGGEPVPRPTRRAGWVPWTVAAVLFLALAAAVAWILRPAPPPGIARFSIALGEGQQFSSTPVIYLAISSDGTQLLYGANNRLYVRSLADTEARVIAGSDVGGAISSPAFSPDGRSVAFYSPTDRALKKLAVTGGAPVTICAVPGALAGVSWDSQGILFSTGPSVYRVSPDGGNPAMVFTAKDQVIARPHLLPGGEAVLFTVSANGFDSARALIAVQNLKSGVRKIVHEGGSDARYLPTGHIVYALGGTLFALPFNLKRLEVSGSAVPVVEGVQRGSTGSAGDAQFDVSENGSLLYVPGAPGLPGANQTSLALIDRKGAVEPLKLPPGAYGFPRLSRDGMRVAYEADEGKESGIWVWELSGAHAPTRVTLAGTGANRYPVWAPDGERIAFQSDREGAPAIYWQRADGAGTAERLTEPDKDAYPIPDSWSPDGQTLAFTVAKNYSAATEKATLWMLSVRDKRATVFGESPVSDYGRAVFSPDGHWLTYQDREGAGAWQIYVQPFPATASKYQISREGNYNRHPVWSPDGKEIFYIAGVGSAVDDVSVTLQPSFTSSALTALPRPFTPGVAPQVRNYDVLPDGKHFLGVVPAGQPQAGAAAAPQLQVVLNWSEEVKQSLSSR